MRLRAEPDSTGRKASPKLESIMTNPNPQPVSEADLDALVERLNGYKPIRFGRGQWRGPPMCEEAATAITSLRNQLAASEARARELREALESLEKVNKQLTRTALTEKRHG